jgi:hypothetical protein
VVPNVLGCRVETATASASAAAGGGSGSPGRGCGSLQGESRESLPLRRARADVCSRYGSLDDEPWSPRGGVDRLFAVAVSRAGSTGLREETTTVDFFSPLVAGDGEWGRWG